MGDRTTCPQLRSYPRLRGNSCSPNSGLAVGLGTSEGRIKCRGPSAGNAPAECPTPFPARRPHASRASWAPREPVGQGPESAFRSLFPAGCSGERYASCPERRASVPQLPSPGLTAARAAAVVPRDPALPATRGVCRAWTCLPRPGERYRPLIFSSSTRVSLFPTVGSDFCLPRRAGPPATVWSPARGARDRFTKGSLVSWGHTRTRVRES